MSNLFSNSLCFSKKVKAVLLQASCKHTCEQNRKLQVPLLGQKAPITGRILSGAMLSGMNKYCAFCTRSTHFSCKRERIRSFALAKCEVNV